MCCPSVARSWSGDVQMRPVPAPDTSSVFGRYFGLMAHVDRINKVIIGSALSRSVASGPLRPGGDSAGRGATPVRVQGPSTRLRS